MVHRLIAREEINPEERNILVSHQFYLPKGMAAEDVERMDSEIRTVGNIDEVSADVLDVFDYAALGHIHKPMKVGEERFRYCGTPLACSISEAGQQKSILMVEFGAKSLENADTTENAGEKDAEETADLEAKHRELSGTAGDLRKMIDAESTGRTKQSADMRITPLPLTPLREIRVIRGTLEEVLKQACSDYVTVVLTDRTDLEVIDMQERLRLAFPYLLEIRRETMRTADYSVQLPAETELDPYELCCAFLKDADEAEKAILRDVIRKVCEEE
ncbi:MAG: exonuclease SbcCD subunit D C-terminal domain-containing protein [Clostridiales bacterium]|nr:exonuclease SbcCD subunit D C-terminal domain-containing protein [Clostridiales bacterium]